MTVTTKEYSDELPGQIFHLGASVPIGRGLLALRYVYKDYDQNEDSHTGYVQIRQRLGNGLDISFGGEIVRGGNSFYYLGFEAYF